MLDTLTLTNRIKSKAFELGFAKAGVAKARKLDGTFLENWLKNGFHGTMSWMERTKEKRTDPEKYLPGVKSIIALALNYYCKDTPRKPETAQVSRYAVGRDYHNVIREKLQPLCDFIKELAPGAETKIAVDDAPVLDKVWAAYAGIGWIGKHSNLITRDFGSYVFLAEILLTEELIYDREMPDYCGTCTMCIDACPTQAILDNKVVDSNKCISYRTIEFRGDFPDEWAGKNEDWVFGCDICQEVCPWNKFTQMTQEPDFLPGEGSRFPHLDDICGLTQDEFQARYKDSPVKRSKWEGFLRNARNVQARKNSFQDGVSKEESPVS